MSDATVHVLKNESVGAMAAKGQFKAWKMFASNVSLSYGELLESILEFPSDAELPRPLDEAAKSLKDGAGVCYSLQIVLVSGSLSSPE